MNVSGGSSSTPSPIKPGISPYEANVEDSATTESNDVVRQVSTEVDSPKVSLSGVVDAIREVGRQRKSLLDKARSALLSGDDAEALRYTRQLCGLAPEGI